MPQRLRIFISSPADVPDERLRADLIVDKLSLDYGRFFTIESYRWEHEAMLASAHFQDTIEPPSAFDIVVLILWSRLGTPLPEKTAAREYRGIDGRAPVTGTEWEYEEALQVAQEKKAPDLLAFRNISPAPIDPRDPAAQAESIAQLGALNEFWTRHFADKGVFLAAYDEYHTLEEFAQRLEESLRKLIERRIKDASAGEPRTEPVWLGDPFRGLESYEFEHAPIFFGRDAAVAKATEQLASNARAGCAFLLVSGASGSGKSSLVKAGIVPHLMKPQRISGLAFLRRVVFRPGSEGGDVFLGFAKTLIRAGSPDVGLPELVGPGQDATQLATHLRGAVGEPGYLFGNALGRLTEAERQSGRLLGFEDAKLILIVDQLEELFTASGAASEQRRQFTQLLGGLARSGAVWVIATLRADFWHRAAEIPELVALAERQGRIDLAVPSAAELAEMIRKPAQAAGLSFEVHAERGIGLDAVLAEHAAAAPGALPLLSFTLDELYRDAKARGAPVLSHASYEALGGLDGAIAKRADEAIAGLPTPAQESLPRVLRALTTVAETTEQTPVARAAALDSFPQGSPARTLIDAFVAARLLVATDESGAGATVRLAHEALISRWQRARDQLAADRRDLQTRTLVERQYSRWSQARGGARRLLLLRNPDLANAVDLAKRWGDELDAPMRDFINRSARRARLAQTLTAVAAVLFAFFALAAVVAAWQRQIAVTHAIRAESDARTSQRQAELRQVRVLAELATSQRLQGNLDTALRIATQATRLGLSLDQHGIETLAAPDSLVASLDQADWRILFNARTGETSAAHGAGVTCAAFSPDGKRIVTTSDDQTARIWDAATGKQIAVLRGHEGTVLSAAFSSDGKRIVTASYHAVRIWDAATGKQIAVLPLYAVDYAAFSPDGTRIVTASDDNTALIWDAATGKQIAVLREDGVRSAAFGPDGKRIVTASGDKTARIWDAATGEQIAVLRGHEAAVASAAFSPDGTRIVTASDDKTARLWDAATATQIAVLRGHDGAVNSAAFSPDGTRIVTASADKTVRIWDAATGEQIAALRGHEDFVYSAAFSPDGTRIVTASADKTARIWDTATSKQVAVLRGHESAVNSAAFSPDGTRTVTASWDNTARIWDAATGKQIAVLRGHENNVLSATFSPDGTRIVTASWDKTARIWDAATGKQIAVLEHEDAVRSAAFSPDGKRIVTASGDKTARIWDAATGKQIAVLRGHEGTVVSAAFSPDGTRIVTASDDKTARVWDAATGKQIAVLRGHEFYLFSAAFSPDGTRIVTASRDTTARIWDAATGQQIAVLRGHEDAVVSAVFSPDGTRIVTASNDKTARIWDAATGKQIAVLRGHEGGVNSAAFSPDGTRIVTASADTTARIWDAATGKQIAVLRGHEGGVASAAFSPDGTRVVTASADKTARIWDVRYTKLSPKGLIGEACLRPLHGISTMSRDDMSLAGYPDSTPPIDVCAGTE
jgi:WD40 repeat protein